LEVRIVLLARKRPVAQDVVKLDFVALRTLEEQVATTVNGLPVRWAATYYPAAGDRFQIFAYSGAETDTIAAKEKFDHAGAPASAASGTRPLVGVVRPPNRNNKSWGLAVGEALPNGQLRFSFDRKKAMALCAWMSQKEPTRRITDKGFNAPSTFRVREIAVEANDAALRPTVECSKFSVG
jgi:hypothetical protein